TWCCSGTVARSLFTNEHVASVSTSASHSLSKALIITWGRWSGNCNGIVISEASSVGICSGLTVGQIRGCFPGCIGNLWTVLLLCHTWSRTIEGGCCRRFGSGPSDHISSKSVLIRYCFLVQE